MITRKAYWSIFQQLTILTSLGFHEDEMSPAQFAKEKIDPEFKTNFTSFMQVYLKSKYSKETLSASEEKIVQNFYYPFYQSM